VEKPLPCPLFPKTWQFEVELAVKIDKNFVVESLCVANDLTARDAQREAQETKSPWALAKGFKQSCGLGNWMGIKDLQKKNLTLNDLELRLTHNGQWLNMASQGYDFQRHASHRLSQGLFSFAAWRYYPYGALPKA